jgi:hypothetical protein
MQRIVILGGGVGATLTANLLVRKLHRQIDRGEVRVTVVDRTGAHVYQPGFMYIAMGGEKAENLQRPERSLLSKKVELVTADAVRVDTEVGAVELADGTRLTYDHLVLATGSRIVPEEIEYFETEAHHFYSAEAALKLRHALDAFEGGKIVVGIAGMPYKCPPAPARGRLPDRDRAAQAASARQDGDALLLADRPRVHDRIGERDGHADPGEAGHRAPHLLQRRDHRSGQEARSEPRRRGVAVRPADPRAAAPRREARDRTAASRRARAGCRRIARRSR